MVKRVVRAGQGGLEVAQHGVDPAQLEGLRGLPAPARHMALVRGAGVRDLRKRVQAIGNHMRGGCQAFRGLVLDGLVGKAGHRRQAHEARLAIRAGLHRRDEGRLAARAAPAIDVARAFAARIGVIDLHAFVQAARLLAQEHGLQKLVLDKPGSLVRHPPTGVSAPGR